MTKPMLFGLFLLMISLIIDIVTQERTSAGMSFQLLATVLFIFALLTDAKTIYTDEERLGVMGHFGHSIIEWDDIGNYTGDGEFKIIIHANKLNTKSIRIDLRDINDVQAFLNMIDKRVNNVGSKRFKIRNDD